MNKIAQFTNLDKKLVDGPRSRNRRQVEQKALPFEDWSLRQDIESDNSPYKEVKPTEPLSLNYPELSPEMIKYRQLNEKELNRLRGEDDEDYRRHMSQYWTREQPFKPTNERYYQLNEALPDDAKKYIIDNYNKFRAAAAEFQAKYNEANQIASQDIELDYGGSYIDLFKNFAKFIVANINKHIGVLFGTIPSKRGEYHDRASDLALFIREGINIFNITPFNIESKVHQMQSARHAMRRIIDEYERRKKVLKKLPQLDSEVKRFLLKKENRAFLKWMDEYFPNDKEDFMEGAVREVLSTFETQHGAEFKLGNLNKIKTYSDIFWKARSSSTLNLYFSMERQVGERIKTRLKDEVMERVLPKIQPFAEVVLASSADNMDPLIKYVYKNFKLDLRSIMGFVDSSMNKYYEAKSEVTEADKAAAKQEAAENFRDFRGAFMEDLKAYVRSLMDIFSGKERDWKIESSIEHHTNEFLKAFFDKGKPNREALNKLTDKDINELVTKYFRSFIINRLPNFERRNRYSNYEYKFPGFGGIGSFMKDTGKFSIDSVVNNVHDSVPFVPKEFILNIVRSLFKAQIPKTEKFNSIDEVFQSLHDLKGTTPATAMKVFLDLLKRSGKFNPNSFTNEFIKSYDKIYNTVSHIISEIKTKLSEQDIIEFFSHALRNTDTVERDADNVMALKTYIHNSAGNLNKTDLMKLISNKNFFQYQKVGIVKKVFKSYAQIRNMGGLKGIYAKYGPVINNLKQSGFISKNFDANVKFIINIFNSGEIISPASPFFKKLFEVTSAMETDLQAIEMSEALGELLDNYQDKDKRLFDLDLQLNDRLRFRVLKNKDPRALRVGIETNCCQRIGGVGENAARDSFINPLAGVLILEWKDDTGEWVLVSQSYFHYVPKDHGYILDNIEYNVDNFSKSGVDLSAAYAYLAQQMKAKLNVNYFLAGKSYSKVNTSNFKTKKLRGGDPRFFDRRSGSPYTDFSASDGMDLLAPKFKLENRISDLLQEGKDIKEAFEIMLGRIIKIGMVV